MRKDIALLSLALTLSLSSFAQRYVTFKGIEFSCDIGEVSSKIKTLGFTPLVEGDYVYEKGGKHYAGDRGYDDLVYMYEGLFAGLSCTLFLTHYDDNKSSCSIGLLFKSQDTWEELQLTYDYLKLELKKEFGNGHSIEYFESPYDENTADELKISAVESGKFKYGTIYNDEDGFVNGDILLCISKEQEILLIFSIDKFY